MSKWEKVRLGDIFKVTSGGTPSKSKPEYYKNGSIQWIRTGDLKSKYITKASNSITEEALRNSSAKLFPIDTVLIAMYGATIGACSILAIEATTNQACAAFLPNKRVDSSYLYYFLCSKKNELIKLSVGGAQPNISGTILKGVSIPVPPLEVQKKIAQTLDAALELIALRKKQLAELDNLIKSTFYDMFGDPISNSKDWKLQSFGEHLLKIDSGWSPKCHNYLAMEGEWGVLKLSAVTSGKFSAKENKALPNDFTPDLSIEVYPGDLLFTRKNTKELVGACAYVFKTQSKLMIPDIIFRLVTKPSLSKIYLWKLFNNENFKRCIQSLASGSAGSMPNIPKSRLLLLKIPVPPLAFQNQFAEIVTKIEEQKSLVQKAIDESQYLFDSLMSEYFE